MRKINIGLLSVLFLFLLASCSNSENDKAAKDEIVYASSKDIRDINPHLYSGEMAAQNMVFESLVKNTEDGVEPWLAESWDISEDGLEYTFHLREDVTFSDGEKFNAEAVKQNMDAIMDNEERHAWLDLVNLIDENVVVDEYTYKLVLKHPYYPTLTELGLTRPFRFYLPMTLWMERQRMASAVIREQGRGFYQNIKRIRRLCSLPTKNIGENSLK